VDQLGLVILQGNQRLNSIDEITLDLLESGQVVGKGLVSLVVQFLFLFDLSGYLAAYQFYHLVALDDHFLQ